MAREWTILNWNIRGLNSPDKWLAIRQKIEESAAGILCVQETKRQTFDLAYIQNFFPQRFNKFEYLPSIGASGGISTAWNGALFTGQLLFQNKFSLTMQFTCTSSLKPWILTNIYGPCRQEDKIDFIVVQQHPNAKWCRLDCHGGF